MGEVGSLLRKEIMMILSSETLDELTEFLRSYDGIGDMTIEDDQVRVILKEEYDPGDLNKALVAKGIILNKMEVHKQSLEEQFLELVRHEDQKGGLS